MSILNERIKKRRLSLDLTLLEVADFLGVREATAQRYESGEIKNIKHETIVKLSNILKCHPSYLMGWTDDLNSAAKDESYKQSHGMIIPVFGRVAAGIPIEAIEEVIGTEEIYESMAKNGKHFGLQIKGNSMEPRICEGDIVIVRQQDDAESGQIVIASINGSDATCKRLIKSAESIALVSTNSTYDPMYFSNKDIEEKPVRIIGRVVENRQKY
ncbi:helix-turn-helix domain-containing protein [Lachnospiraceae bacterium ZAX-1]